MTEYSPQNTFQLFLDHDFFRAVHGGQTELQIAFRGAVPIDPSPHATFVIGSCPILSHADNRHVLMVVRGEDEAGSEVMGQEGVYAGCLDRAVHSDAPHTLINATVIRTLSTEEVAAIIPDPLGAVA